MKKHIAIAGGGFSGAVLARALAESDQYRVTLYEEKRHVGGICHTERDEETGVMIHHYGPHIFHTQKEAIWNYMNQWGKFERITHQVKLNTPKGIFTTPLNLQSINNFFNRKLSPSEARDFLGSKSDESIREPRSLEDHALNMVGPDLYRNFFYGYAKKRWGVEPSKLSVCKMDEIKVRFNYNENFYDDDYQGIPVSGYTEIIRRILDHHDITLRLGQRLEPQMKDQFDHVFWSGPMDGFFKFKAGRLGYRTLKFEKFVENGDYQGTAVINHCGEETSFTRTIEFKHLTPWESHEKTVCFKEYTEICGENDLPVIPLKQKQDQIVYENYQKLAAQENKVTFIGRLGTYRSLEIDQMISESLELAKVCLSKDIKTWPKFPHQTA